MEDQENNMMSIMKTGKIALLLSSIAVALSIFVFFFWGLKYGIDFTGGSLMEIEYTGERPEISEISKFLNDSQILENFQIQPVGEKNHILRFESVDEETHQKILTGLKENFGEITEVRFDSIGPTVGKELKEKTIWAIVIVLIAIILYISYVFRKISKPIPSYLYGLYAIIALFHDITIVVGIFCVLGYFYNIEVDAPFVAALLTILGYSINDTIVIFDRIRENLAKHYEGNFEEIVDESISQTLVRSINSSFTVLIVLLAIFFLGGETIRSFTLALILGVIIGTYSSIFIASPLLVITKQRMK